MNQNISRLIAGILLGIMMSFGGYTLAHMYLAKHDKNAIAINEIDKFNQVFMLMKNNYVESVTDDRLMTGALKGLVGNLDPHSNYLDNDSFKELSTLTNGEFGGIGIEVSTKRTAGITVIAPIDGTPAFIAGVKSGDVIVKVNESNIIGEPIEAVIKQMRGKAGTKVKLTIIRSGELRPLQFNITREIIKIESVKYKILSNKDVYLRINSFQGNTFSDLVTTLKSIDKAQPHVHAMILDLRDNPGGLLQGAVGVAGAFLPQNSLIVYTKGRVPGTSVKYYANSTNNSLSTNDIQLLNEIPQQFKHVPLVVLINQGTASAAEIVSGALQDYKRATLMGTTSFGKGSVQTVMMLSGGTGLKFTVSLYFTPKGRSIQAQGIKPNIIVKSVYSDLLKDFDLSENSLSKHLMNPESSAINKAEEESAPVITPSKQIKSNKELDALIKEKLKNAPKVDYQNQAQIDLKNDFQLQWAIKVVDNDNLPNNVKKAIVNANSQ